MHTIDLRETIIPFSLLQITHRFKRMQAGDAIEIIGIDENVITDLKNLLPASNCELIMAEAMSTRSPYFRLWLKKTKTRNIKPKENCHVSNRSEQH